MSGSSHKPVHHCFGEGCLQSGSEAYQDDEARNWYPVSMLIFCFACPHTIEILRSED